MPEMNPGRAVFIIILVGVAIAVAILLNANPYALPTGTLTGNVSIGPLCPVEPCIITPDRIAAAYTSRPLIISTPGGTPVASLSADPATGYTIALRPGIYVVDVVHEGIGGSPELPKTVTVRPGETMWLNISIDTGIR
jgi:hypothetical protein